jgi:hypothetical protein
MTSDASARLRRYARDEPLTRHARLYAGHPRLLLRFLKQAKDVDGRNKSGHDEGGDGTASRACPTCELNDEAQVG